MISKLILGTVQLGLDYGINNQLGKPSQAKAFEILETAYNNNIRFLDTAEAYGNSQEVIGQFQKKSPNKRFNIITKLDANETIKKEDIVSHIKNSCKTLYTEQLYGYMFHNYNSFKSQAHLLDQLILAKNKKLVTKIGISLYHNQEIDDILNNYHEFDFIQIPFNLLDNASKRKLALENAKEKGVEVHVRSVFLQGVFFKEENKIPTKLHVLKKYLSQLNSLKEERVINIETLALQYALQKDYIDYVLVGVDSPEQLINNLNISTQKVNIPHTIIDSIDVKETTMLNPSNWS